MAGVFYVTGKCPCYIKSPPVLYQENRANADLTICYDKMARCYTLENTG